MTPKYSVLISYSTLDSHIVDKIYSALNSKNINCWVAHKNIQPGESWPASISEAIFNCNIFLLLLTKNSNTSKQVIRELTQADSFDKKLYCFQLENISTSPDIRYFFSSIHKQQAFSVDIELSIKKLVEEIAKSLNIPINGPTTDKTRSNSNPNPVLSHSENLPLENKIIQIPESIEYQNALKSNTVRAFEKYLNLYPKGFFVIEAGNKIESLKRQENDKIIASPPFTVKSEMIFVEDEVKLLLHFKAIFLYTSIESLRSINGSIHVNLAINSHSIQFSYIDRPTYNPPKIEKIEIVEFIEKSEVTGYQNAILVRGIYYNPVEVEHSSEVRNFYFTASSLFTKNPTLKIYDKIKDLIDNGHFHLDKGK